MLEFTRFIVRDANPAGIGLESLNSTFSNFLGLGSLGKSCLMGADLMGVLGLLDVEGLKEEFLRN